MFSRDLVRTAAANASDETTSVSFARATEAVRDYRRTRASAWQVEQLRFTTVIAMRAPFFVVDDTAHVLVQQIGTGTATVFTEGLAIAAATNASAPMHST